MDPISFTATEGSRRTEVEDLRNTAIGTAREASGRGTEGLNAAFSGKDIVIDALFGKAGGVVDDGLKILSSKLAHQTEIIENWTKQSLAKEFRNVRELIVKAEADKKVAKWAGRTAKAGNGTGNEFTKTAVGSAAIKAQTTSSPGRARHRPISDEHKL